MKLIEILKNHHNGLYQTNSLAYTIEHTQKALAMDLPKDVHEKLEVHLSKLIKERNDIIANASEMVDELDEFMDEINNT